MDATRAPQPIDDRMRTLFWSKVDKTADCWVWTSHRYPNGYGHLHTTRNGRTVNHYAHRFAYIECVGPIPDGLVLDHLCRNRACCNPAHLEPVTQAENIRRGEQHQLSRMTHCLEGHALTDDNVFINRLGHMTCRACKNARWRKSFEQRQSASLPRKSGVRGVTWDRARRKWRGLVRVNYRLYNCGYFDTIEAAAAAVAAKRRELTT